MKLYIWGTGRLVGKVIGKYIELEQIEAFIDNNRSKDEYMGKRVIHPETLCYTEYDAILVINLFSQEIYKQCKKLGINLNKVIFLYSNCELRDLNKDYGFVEKILGKEYTQIVKERYHVVRSVEAYGDLCFAADKLIEGGYEQSDYIRIKCFELVVKEIRKRKVLGAVAEVGVFRGEFAQYINFAFPDRKCYLFDTFDSFNVNEALKEIQSKNCTEAFIEAYKQTNVGTVLQKMRNLDKVIIKQGFFPDSLEGLEEEFAFVSIDVDFEDSIYEGLKYFYPRLVKGGYIFIHDYNSSLQGVEKAIDRYEKDFKVILCKMPICDANGTLVIMK